MPRKEYWTDEQVAAYLGLKVDGVRSWCSRRRIKRVHLTPADEVRKAKAAMPGAGARTDLSKPRDEEDHGESTAG